MDWNRLRIVHNCAHTWSNTGQILVQISNLFLVSHENSCHEKPSGRCRTVRQCTLLRLRRGRRCSTGAKATSGTGESREGNGDVRYISNGSYRCVWTFSICKICKATKWELQQSSAYSVWTLIERYWKVGFYRYVFYPPDR